MKRPSWILSYKQENSPAGALPEIDRALTMLRAAGAPAPKLEDRILMRLRVEQAGTLSLRNRGERRGIAIGSRSLLDFGLAGAAACLLGVLILAGGAHRKLVTTAVDSLQPAANTSMAVPSLDKEARPADSFAGVPSLGLAAARREPPRQIATGNRAGRVSLVDRRARRRGRARRPSTP